VTALIRWRPHVFAAALCVGLAAPNVLRVGEAALALAALAASAAVVSEPFLRAASVGVLVLLLGWWWGSARVEALDESRLAVELGRTAPVRAVITAPARRGMFALRVHADVHRLGRLEVDEPALLLLPLGRAPPQGAVIEFTGKVELPRAADSGFDERAWLRRRGAHVVIRGGAWRAVGRRGGIAGLGDRLHERLADTVAPGVEGERRGVIAGIVLGEDEGLSDELRNSFRASGLYHVLAVSGQNVAFLAAGVLLLAWLTGIPRWAGEIGVLAAIAAYVLAVGLQPSVVRAGVAGALASLAWLASRPRDRWYFLLLGAGVLLAWNPYNLLDPGFQLSFAAVAAIFVAVARLERRLEGYPLPPTLAEVVAVSAACGAATAPIVWFHFQAIPLYTVVSNALGTIVVAPILGLGLVAAALDPVWPAGAATVAWANGWLAAYLAGVARVVAALPFAQLTSGRALVAIVVAAALVAAAMRLGRRARRRLGAVAAAAVVAAVAWSALPEPVPPPPEGLRMTFLDVGQGDATLIQVGGSAVLVDEGPPEARVADQLRRLGVRRLDALLMTHPSRDNIGGAEEILRTFDVGLVLDPALPFDNPFGRPALAEARRRRIPIDIVRAGRAYRIGGLTLRVVWPNGTATRAAEPNDHATVLLASYGAIDALLPADAESNVTLPLRLPPVEIVKVAHHGSKDAGLDALLDRIRPTMAIVSVGAHNDYGHPAPSTLAALAAERGLRTYRTDRHGRITIESDGRRLEVWTER
jgi:competence protein ComEC